MIRLRPVQPTDVDALTRQYTDEDACGAFLWWGFQSGARFRELVATNDLISEDRGILAVVDDAENLIGEVSWHTVDNTTPPHGRCWNLGIWLLPEARGRGAGTAAHRVLAEYLFAHTSYERIEAGTELDNVAEQRALERAGFTKEGVLRRAAFRAGAYRDMVLYSKLRGEA
jgi:RimJ/RimL family protein N-acetyltransferase